MNEDLPGALVIGAGPAGLRAAEELVAAGHPVTVVDRSPWPGRKLLVAGRGGLNLTHSEPPEAFLERFRGGEDRWPDLLGDFGAAAVRAWAEGHGVETYVGSSGRVFPRGRKAAALLRACLRGLGDAGAVLRTRRTLRALEPGGVVLEGPEGEERLRARAVILALGGGSWPRTGSDGSWVAALREAGVPVRDLGPSNCGFETGDFPEVRAAHAGDPLKNVALEFGDTRVRGDLVLTRYGLEGGPVYRLSAALREALPATVHLDLTPDLEADRLLARLRAFKGKGSRTRQAAVAWRIREAARALFHADFPSAPDPDALVARAKALPVTLIRPRPLAEAISSAGGVAWEALTPDLEVRDRPGLFVAGEMLDWDAPTGGYLLTGCLATGTRAGRAAAARLAAG